MFILNAFCCASQHSESAATPKPKSIIKIASDQPNINPNDLSIPLHDQNHQKNNQQQVQPSECKTPTFSKLQSINQSFKSDECNAGSNVTSIEEEVSDKYVSPVGLVKFQSNQKENDYLSMRNTNFYNYDFTDTEVRQWSIKQVLKFLGKVGLKHYHNTFYENKIKGKDLVSLSEKELRDDLLIEQKDIKTILVYIQLLKEKAQRQKKVKEMCKTPTSQRRHLSLYKSHSNTYSCRKILNLVKNPIVEEESEEDNANGEYYEKKDNYTTKDVYSTTHFSELLTN